MWQQQKDRGTLGWVNDAEHVQGGKNSSLIEKNWTKRTLQSSPAQYSVSQGMDFSLWLFKLEYVLPRP